jgi:hypothetical protein
MLNRTLRADTLVEYRQVVREKNRYEKETKRGADTIANYFRISDPLLKSHSWTRVASSRGTFSFTFSYVNGDLKSSNGPKK